MRKPKYALHIFKSEEFNIDSASYVSFPDYRMFISDKLNNEQPRMTLSYIGYPRRNETQLRIAIGGQFHIERLSYYVKEPALWREKIWIIIPMSIIDDIIAFLNKNPYKLHNWV